MKAKIEYKSQIEDIQNEVSKMQEQLGPESKKALTQIGEEASKVVRRTAPRSDKEKRYKNGRTVENVHIQDDVVYKVKKSRKSKENYVSVSGGKNTWPKWHVADEGHVAANGRFIPGNGFVEKATIQSGEVIDSIVDSFLGRIVDG